jgi:hypothetical protein
MSSKNKIISDRTQTPKTFAVEPKTEVKPKTKIKLTIKAKPKINVMIACCGMLRDHEVFRQINEGIVGNFGELQLEGFLLRPDTITAVPDTPITRKAIEDGILIIMPG